MRRPWKRLFDRAWTPVALVVFGPIALLIVVAIVVDDGFPILFLQQRLGTGRRPFRILKFRTMRDGRVTCFGAVLRKTGLDEVPQILNVLRGEMSLVGPRPLTEADVQRLGWTTRRHDFRWCTPPGITGLSQVRAKGSARESLLWDRLYLRRSGPLLDMQLLAVTLVMNFVGKAKVKRLLFGGSR